MLDVLQQFAALFPDLSREELAVYELRLKELQSCANARILESLLYAELRACEQHRRQRIMLEAEKDNVFCR